MEHYLRDGLDLLKKVNGGLPNKMTALEIQACHEALNQFEASKDKLEKILNQAFSGNKEDAIRLLNRIKGNYRELWKPLYLIQTSLIYVMDENGLGRNSQDRKRN